MAKSEFVVVQAYMGDALLLAPCVREEDRLEMEASHGTAPLPGLVAAIRASCYSRAVIWQDRIAALFGVASVTVETGSVWMLASPLADHHPAAFMRMCRREKEGLFSRGHASLVNFIDARNTKSLRWARAIGFEVQEPIPHGRHGLPFHPVVLRKERPCASQP